MAGTLSISAVATGLGTARAVKTELDNTYAVIKSSAGSVYTVEVDNTLNTVPVYVKFYDDATPDVGTDDPHLVVFAAAAEVSRRAYNKGVAFATAITAACVTTSGTAGVTAPTNPVNVTIDR